MRIFSQLYKLMVLATIITGLSFPASAKEVDLRVLLITVGNAVEDPTRSLIEEQLEGMGVPYDVIDSRREDLTHNHLVNGTRGRYNGIILTQADTYLYPEGKTGFDFSEFQVLHQYERDFGVREAIVSGFPTTNPSLGLDYGMSTVGSGAGLTGRWTKQVGEMEVFEYIQTGNTLPTEGFTFTGVPRNDPAGPMIEPLLVDDANPSATLISRLTYPDGRQVLLSTLSNAHFMLHSRILAYEFVNFATSGLFIGARRIYLSVHNDDLFLADEVWNPETNSNYPENILSYRASTAEIENLVASQNEFRNQHPLAGDLFIELAFNGAGANLSSDPLTAAIVANRDNLRFINHTFKAIQMDRICPDPDEPQITVCPITTYAQAFDDIRQNLRAFWRLGLPELFQNIPVLLTDSHSGLHDRNSTPEEPSDDIPFPWGLNPNLMYAAMDNGVRYIASDASQPNQDVIQRIPGFEKIILLPRYPTAIFYNTRTPEENTSEYNYIHHYRYLEQGLNPCIIPGAICSPRSYQEILDAEANTTLRHMLAMQPFPHYFHQSNLYNYSDGKTLQFDWLNAVMEAYEQHITLPVLTPRFHQVGLLARKKINAELAAPRGYLDTVSNIVTLWADNSAIIEVTGLAGGELYGGQSISTVEISRSPQSFNAEHGTEGNNNSEPSVNNSEPSVNDGSELDDDDGSELDDDDDSERDD